jgi:hypothetical protein
MPSSKGRGKTAKHAKGAKSMKGGKWLPQRARRGTEGGSVWSAAARRRFGSNSRKRPLRKTRKSRKGRVGRQGSNSRDSQLRIERITRMGKGGVRDRTAGAANYERYESHERGRGAAEGGGNPEKKRAGENGGIAALFFGQPAVFPSEPSLYPLRALRREICFTWACSRRDRCRRRTASGRSGSNPCH